MRNERKYMILTILSIVMVSLLLVNCGREYWRMAAASDRQTHEYIALGAKLYAENCIQCHGPQGEGSVGLTLNRPDLQGDARDSRYADTYRMIYSTIENGRPGRNTTHWVPTDNGSWISYSQMPPWGRNAGGPMDEHMLKGLAYFIMMGDELVNPAKSKAMTFWLSIGTPDFPTAAPNTTGELPMATMSADAAENARLNEEAQAILLDPSMGIPCLACHAIGSRGATVGPNLSLVGDWVDEPHRDRLEAFLQEWVYDAPSVPSDKRMPLYWAANRTGTPEPVLTQQILPDPVRNRTTMPSFKAQWDNLGLEKRDLLVRYLMGLRSGGQ